MYVRWSNKAYTPGNQLNGLPLGGAIDLKTGKVVPLVVPTPLLPKSVSGTIGSATINLPPPPNSQPYPPTPSVPPIIVQTPGKPTIQPPPPLGDNPIVTKPTFAGVILQAGMTPPKWYNKQTGLIANGMVLNTGGVLIAYPPDTVFPWITLDNALAQGYIGATGAGTTLQPPPTIITNPVISMPPPADSLNSAPPPNSQPYPPTNGTPPAIVTTASTGGGTGGAGIDTTAAVPATGNFWMIAAVAAVALFALRGGKH